MPRRTVITIGNFDGAHIGHAALIRGARAIADGQRGVEGRVVAMAFDPHPLTVLAPQRAPAMLMGFERKSELLRAAGADEVMRLEPTPELLDLSPGVFIERLAAELRPVAIVEGGDFRFGRSRAGDIETLRELGRRMGFEGVTVAAAQVALTDQTLVTASSTLARWLVGHGRMADARLTLGRPHELTGVVVRGDQRGREIGYPTANIEARELLPADGVYAGRAHLADGRAMPAAVHVGPRATFNDVRPTVEAYLLDWGGPVAEAKPEYGWQVRLEVVAWLRDQARFDSVAGLVRQIERDVQRTREALRRIERRGAPAPSFQEASA